MFFFLSFGLSAIGALFAVAIVAPLAMPCARRHGINLLLMGMMVVYGALGGAFSPITVYGAFVNDTMARTGLPSSPGTLFLTPLLINIVIAAVLYAVLGGRALRGRRAEAPRTRPVPGRRPAAVAGTIPFVNSGITAIGAPLLAALLLCYLGGVLSAFASSVAILGVAIPLAVPFLQQGEVGAVGMVAALAVAATVVDVSPFSTNGALVLANAPADVDRDRFYRQMLGYAGIVVAVRPLLAWGVLVLPGLL